MNFYYSRVPSAAIKLLHDGRQYVLVPHRFDGVRVTEDFAAPRLLRFTEPDSYIANGEAYVLFAKSGNAVPVPCALPFGVTVTHKP